MVAFTVMLLVLVLNVSLVDAFQHAFSTSGSGKGIETRFSTLRPWLEDLTPNKDTTTVSKSSNPLIVDPIIGWALEERDDLMQSHKVTVGWGSPDAAVKDSATTVNLPYFPPEETALGGNQWPSGLATAILLHSPSMEQKLQGKQPPIGGADNKFREVLELGSGLGLPGLLVAQRYSASCKVTLTDNEVSIVRELAKMAHEQFLEQSLERSSGSNGEVTTAAAAAKVLDWLEVSEGNNDPPLARLVLGSDIAYQPSLVQPLVDTIRAVLDPSKEDAATVFVGGQADRKSFWELYETLEDTRNDESSSRSNTQMLLYRLHMGDWRAQEDDDDENSEIKARLSDAALNQRWNEIPVGLLWYQPWGALPSLTEFDYLATLNDKEGMSLTF